MLLHSIWICTFHLVFVRVFFTTKSCKTCVIYGSETWPMKMEHGVKLDRTEVCVIRLMYGFTLKRKKSAELRELLGF